MANVEQVIRQYEKLKSDRQQWDDHWEDLARVMLPRRLGFVSPQTPGERRTDDIYDGTPMQAARGLANAIGGMLRPQGQQWFFLKTESEAEDRSDAARQWLDMAQERMLAAIVQPKARFLQSTGETDLDLVVFGTGALYIGENDRNDGLLFTSLHLKDCYIRISHDGMVDTMFRRRPMTARQAVQKWGDKAGSKAKKLASGNKPDETVEYLHAVYPREDGKADALLAKSMLFASLWVEVESKEVVAESGFPEFPYVVPRWDTSSGEVYGRSPGMIALPDSNTLQAVGETMLVAGQKAADPPLMMPDDGMISAMSTAAGGIGYYDAQLAREMGGNPVFPLNTGANLPLTLEMQQDIRAQIYSAYFRNVLNLPIDGPQMTATEVMQRKEEFIREIGAVFGRLEADYTAPMVERVFNIMVRASKPAWAAGVDGVLPLPPEELLGQNIRFEYESPIKKVRQQVEAVAVNQYLAEVAQAAQLDPSALDNVDLDQYARFLADVRGVPHEILRGAEQVQQLREMRAQAQQQAQMLEMAERGVDIAGKVAGMGGAPRAELAGS